jgi:acyl-CoA synthetase (NDP forming)
MNRNAALQAVLASRSLVIFGASRDPFKTGSMLIQVLRDHGFTGQIAGVNPGGGEVHGIPLYRRLAEVPFKPELGVLHIPPGRVPEVVAECAEAGCKGVVISAEGFAESGAEGKRFQQAIQTTLKNSGMLGFGPNTLGIINTATGLTTSYFADANMLHPGSIGLAAQSGIFIGALLRFIASFENLKLSKGLGLGNKVDVDEVDALTYFEVDEQTRTIVLYLEDIRDGRRFLETAARVSRTKPILLLKGGRTELGARAIASHTASLAVDDRVLEGALKQTGVIRLDRMGSLPEHLMGCEWLPLPRGNRIALVTFSGAQAIMTIDAATRSGLELAVFSESTQERIATVIASRYKAQNPIDIFPDMMAHGFEKTVVEILKALLADDGVDGIIFISFVMSGPEPYHPVVELLQTQCSKPVFISLLGAIEDIRVNRDYLLGQRIPCVDYPEDAVRVFRNLWGYARYHLGDR